MGDPWIALACRADRERIVGDLRALTGLALWLALLAALCFAIMLAIFVVWTLPANQATQNWTTIPANWEALRQQWEYSHAVNTAIVFAALCLATLSALSWRPADL